LVSFVSLKRKMQRYSQASMKWILPLLFILGFAVSFLSYHAIMGELLPAAIAALFICVFSAFGGILLVLLIPFAVDLHNSFRRLFEHAFEVREMGTAVWARVPVSLALNLAYFTAIFFVPFSILVETVPLGKLVGNVAPNYTFTDLMTSSLSLVLFFVFSGTGGPATVYLIRYLRVDRGRDEIGGRTVTLLQVLCYISWLSLALFFGAHLGFDAEKANFFLLVLFGIVLPATFANLVAFGLVRYVYRSKYIF